MAPTKSRSQRKAAFLHAAGEMYERLEAWYDAHPTATFEELEQELRQERRALMGEALATLIVGRDSGYQPVAPPCPQCGQPMRFEGYRPWTVKGLEGDSVLERAYYRCPDCVGTAFSPLDQKLALRADHWSGGAARVATRLGLQGPSFDLAAEGFSDAVGRDISGDSVARLTEGWGRQVAEQRSGEAERANRPGQRGERLSERRIPEVAPITTQANISTDGAMILVREEGWKEVKIVAISEVRVQPASARPSAQPSRREADPLVTLTRHSYQAGLWDADTTAQYQYAEGLRRGLDYCPKRSSVNDGALWIKRITDTNFPGVPQIVDWSHASGHVWAVANAVYGEQTAAAQQWAEAQLEHLWTGQVAQVVAALDQLDLGAAHWPAIVREAPDYFRSNQDRMRYDDFRRQGYPIGSGTVESAAQTVVHHRLRRPGRGWARDNGQAMLAGLSELHSGRFELAWYHLAVN